MPDFRHSSPPPPARPGIRKCRDDIVARTLHEWASRRGITSAEIAEVLDVSRTLARKLRREGREGKPVHASDLLALPERYRDQLWALLTASFDTARTGTHG